MTKRWLFLTALSFLTLTLASCGGDDPTAPAPADTGPEVLGSSPVDGQSGVATTTPLTIVFDRVMDPATAPGNIEISRGLITNFVWMTDRVLQVEHTAWDEGLDVVLTVGTGLADPEGNALTGEHRAEFWTETTEVLVLAHTPDADAAGVIRNAPLAVTFSRYMDTGSLATGITASSTARADHPFTVRLDRYYRYLIAFDPPLPASTEIDVAIGTGCEDTHGTPLAAPVGFSFTTGPDAELDLPRIVAWEPAIDAIVPADQPYLRITFDKPVDTTTWRLILMDVNFALAFELGFVGRHWSDGDRTVTLGLMTPLPAGVRFSLGIERFKDIYGNESAAPYLWNATVEGTPEYLPAEERLGFRYEGTWRTANGVEDSGPAEEFISFEIGTDGDFTRRHSQTQEGDATILEFLTRTAEGLLQTGLTYDPEGFPTTVTYTPGVQLLQSPLTETTWSGTSGWSDGGITTGQLDWTVTVLPGTEDIEWPTVKTGGRWLDTGAPQRIPAPPVVMMTDCRTVVVDKELTRGGLTTYTSNDTLVYCPGFGQIESRTHVYSPSIAMHHWQTLTIEGISLLTPPFSP